MQEAVNTLYLDDNVLNFLVLKDDVYRKLERVGWVTFMNIKCPTYIRPTLEFLRSVDANVLYREGYDEGHISFHLFNTEHDLNL